MLTVASPGGKAGKRQGERAVCVQLDIVLTALDDILLHAVVIDSNLPSERLFGLGKQLLVRLRPLRSA